MYDKKEGYQTNLEDRKSHELYPIGKQNENALLYDGNKGGAKMINEKRPAQLLQYLLRVREATMHQLIDHFQLSKRQICYDLDKINHWLTGKQLPEIEYKRKNRLAVPEKLLELRFRSLFRHRPLVYFYTGRADQSLVHVPVCPQGADFIRSSHTVIAGQQKYGHE